MAFVDSGRELCALGPTESKKGAHLYTLLIYMAIESLLI